MLGFLTGVTEEMITGHPILQQIGFTTPSPVLGAAVPSLLISATVAATFVTLFSAEQRDMRARTATRLARLFGLDDQAENTAKQMKIDGDFTSPTDEDAAVAAKRRGTAADAVLSFTDESAAEQAALENKVMGDFLSADNQLTINDQSRAMKSREQAQAFNAIAQGVEQGVPQAMAVNYEEPARDPQMAWMKQKELDNGRWAMIGFALAVAIEAGTGNGVFGQLITLAKMVGLLGPDSGF